VSLNRCACAAGTPARTKSRFKDRCQSPTTLLIFDLPVQKKYFPIVGTASRAEVTNDGSGPPPNCTLVAPSSKRPEDWLTRNYTDTRTGRAVKLNSTFRGKKIQPQTLSNLLWRHFLHPEAKSLGPDGNPCEFHTTGLLQRRPISAMTPFQFIGKEIERKAQEGEDISALDSSGPVQYRRNRTPNTYAADPSQILRAKKFGLRQLVRESGVQQHAVERFRNGERVHPSTRVGLLEAMEKLEKALDCITMSAPFSRAYGRQATTVYSGRGADIVMQSSGY
jgi:hypothetical protein